MMDRSKRSTVGKSQTSAFEAAASKAGAGPVHELWYFLRMSKKWWLLPIIFVLLLLSGLMLLSGTGAAPFIYTLF